MALSQYDQDLLQTTLQTVAETKQLIAYVNQGLEQTTQEIAQSRQLIANSRRLLAQTSLLKFPRMSDPPCEVDCKQRNILCDELRARQRDARSTRTPALNATIDKLICQYCH